MPLCPWLPVAGILIYAFLIADMGLVPLLSAGAFFAVAGLWYLAYVRWRITRESAAVYMARSMMSGQVARAGIEDELVQISLEREGVDPDRFDELVRRAAVLDIAEELDARGLFARLAAALSPRLGLAPERIEALFLERERESSTVIHPGLAVPHIVIDGQGVFELALVRCRPGVKFDELHRPVQTAFVLVGSRDERNFHLKALMAVAHIIQEHGFEERWLSARNPEQLRDIVLLARRKRGGIRCVSPAPEGPQAPASPVPPAPPAGAG
jgi:mannitol/fructose-specific phosphotransferase system IIA component (Ntr-type)